MSVSETDFKIIRENNCPLYENGDEFRLSGNAISLELKNEKIFITTAIIKAPNDKKTCRILVGDLTRILIQYESIDKIPTNKVDCSGCTGSISLKYSKERGFLNEKLIKEQKKNITVIANILSNFSIFQSLDKDNLKGIVPFLKLKRFQKEAVIIKKGSPAQNLFIILSGTVDVLNESDICLSTLKKGDVFGEMSLISGDPVGATIKVVEPATIVFIKGEDFKEVLMKFPSIQMYLARLLARRLAKSNIIRAEEFTSGMSGTLSEMPPSELLQILNLNQKTGKLILSLPKGKANIQVKEGDLIYAKYGEMTDEEAIFKILQEKKGRFKFNPGEIDKGENHTVIRPFMELLLEGLKRLDENNNQKKGLKKGITIPID